MGFIDDLKSSAKTEMDSARRSLKLSQLNGELEDLKRIELEAYAAIGRMAVDKYGLKKFDEYGEKITSIQERIAKKEEEIADLESL